jgi:hypothetical protein
VALACAHRRGPVGAAGAGLLARSSWPLHAPIIALPLTLAIAAIAAVGIAIWQIVKHWDSTKGIWGNIKAEFGMFVHWVWDKVKWLLNKIPGVHIEDGPAPAAPGTTLQHAPGKTPGSKFSRLAFAHPGMSRASASAATCTSTARRRAR